MNLARPKPGTDYLCVTSCFYMLFAAILLILFTTAPGSASITIPLFRSKFPIPVKHRLTIFSFPSSFSRFLNLFHQFFPRYTTYDMRYTLLKLPPILRANPPILHNNHPILHGNHPRLKPVGRWRLAVDSWRKARGRRDRHGRGLVLILEG